jgi:hypothetical protein
MRWVTALSDAQRFTQNTTPVHGAHRAALAVDRPTRGRRACLSAWQLASDSTRRLTAARGSLECADDISSPRVR